MGFEDYETNYAREDGIVDFLDKNGPLRAQEWKAEFDSKQILTLPPKDAEIWHEWQDSQLNAKRRKIGSIAIYGT